MNAFDFWLIGFVPGLLLGAGAVYLYVWLVFHEGP